MAGRKKLTKKEVKLGGLSKTIFDSLCINPTTKYVIKKTGKSKESVCRVLKKLVDNRFIDRLGWGHYKVNKINERLSSVNPKSKLDNYGGTTDSDLIANKIHDGFRLHCLQVHLVVNSDHHKHLHNLIFKRKVFKNIKTRSNHLTDFHLTESMHTYQVSKENVFIKFAKGWEINASTTEELMERVHEAIMYEASILETRYGVGSFKDGKINYDFRNYHIASIRNGVVIDLDERGITHYTIMDQTDGKPRIIIDKSKDSLELEYIHPKHGFDDAEEFHNLGENVINGNLRKVLNRGERFFNDSGDTSLSDLKKVVYDLAKIVSNLGIENKETAAGLNSVVQILKMQIPQKIEPDPLDRKRPDYVG